MSRFTILVLSCFAAVSLAPAQLLQGTPPPLNPPPAVPAPQPVVAPAPVPAAPQNPAALVFDAEQKEYNAKQGEMSAPFTFHVTNVSASAVQINSLHTSCGCTVAQLPAQPYTLGAGSNVPINVTVDLRGKMGLITKSISVDSSAGFKSLLVRVNIPQPQPSATPTTTPGGPVIANNGMPDRAKNIQASLADRQAVFKGDCAKCHVEKGIGKLGKDLFTADCAVCHEDEHRAAMVPDLKVPRTHRDLAFWQTWISEGKAGTLMPAFAAAHGGPLTQQQVDSLAIYLYQNFPLDPPAVPVQLQHAQAQAPHLPVPAPPVPPAVQKN